MAKKDKKSNKRDPTPGIVRDKKLLREIAMGALEIDSIRPQEEPLTPDIINKMIRYLDISIPLLSIERGVCSRNIEIMARRDVEDQETLIEIRRRFGKIEKWRDFLKELSRTAYYGFTVFEKIYNEDFSLKKLEYIPRYLTRFDKEKRKWVLKGQEELEISEEKFLICTYGGNLEYPQGNSLFNYGLYQAYVDLSDLEAKVRGLQQKYGSVIPVFGADEDEMDTEEGRAKIKTRAESVNQMTDKNTLVMPISGDYSLKESFFFISLADLKPEMHKVLLERLERKVEKFIKGATFSDSGETGSNAKDQVQQGEKEKIEDDIAVFMANETGKLLESDSLLFGYEAGDFYFSYELDEGETAREELEKKRAETKNQKILTFNEVKNHGYKIKKSRIAETLGIPEEDLEEVEVVNTPGFEFVADKDKKIDLLLKRSSRNVKSLDNLIKAHKSDFTKVIADQALKQFLKMKTIDDLEGGFNYDLSKLQEQLIIVALIGAMDEKEMDQLTVSEFAESTFDPFALEYSEAIAAITERVPAMYDAIEPITETIRERFTWVKWSTELETTKALIGNLQISLEAGKTFKEWISMSEEVLKTTGFGENGWYLNLVWRNNMHSAYNAGAYWQQEENKENKPYGLYDAIEDGRESDICRSLNGQVYPLDHIFWDTYMPPNHHNCRSKRIAVSNEDVKDYGLNISKTVTKGIEELKDKMGDFAGNPAKNIKKAAQQKEKDLQKKISEVKGLL